MGLLWEICRLQPGALSAPLATEISCQAAVQFQETSGRLAERRASSTRESRGEMAFPWAACIQGSKTEMRPLRRAGLQPMDPSDHGARLSCQATPVEVRSATRFVSEDRPGGAETGLVRWMARPGSSSWALQGGMPARCGCSQPPGAPGRAGGGSRTCGKGIAAAAALAYGVAGCASSSIG